MFSLFLCLCNLFLLLLKMAPSNFIEVKKGNRSRNRPPIKASLPPPFLDFPASQWHHVFPILTKKLANLRRQCTHFFCWMHESNTKVENVQLTQDCTFVRKFAEKSLRQKFRISENISTNHSSGPFKNVLWLVKVFLKTEFPSHSLLSGRLLYDRVQARRCRLQLVTCLQLAVQ